MAAKGERFKTWWRANRVSIFTAVGVFVAAAFAFRLCRSAAGWWTIDDASITHAAAFEYADHGSRAMYPEGTPVESYSNPLVFFVVVFLRKLRLFDPITTHLKIETVLFATMTTFVWSTLRTWTHAVAALVGAFVFAALELLTTATWVWYGSGLENVWGSTGIIVMLWLCSHSLIGNMPSPAWGIVLGLAALTRPEAPIHVAAGYFALFVFARPSERSWREHITRITVMATSTAAIFFAFLLWRRSGYGDWLPNTYYAKIGDDSQLLVHLKQHVFGELSRYYCVGLFAASALVLLAIPRLRLLAVCTILLLAGSLALPVMAGDDIWLGHHRFATAMLCMTHASFALLLAVAITRFAAGKTTRDRSTAGALLAANLLPLVLFATKPLTLVEPVWLNDVTTGRVAQLHGAQRWEQQMRVGVPFPVVMTPDAGGSLLVGAMQFVDDAYLSDYQMGHMGKYRYGAAYGLGMMTQYEHEERNPDLISPQQSGVIDMKIVNARYWPGAGYLFARKDLVEATVPPGAPLVETEQFAIYLSPRTVSAAAPRSLVRYELIIQWRAMPAEDAMPIARATVDDDRDDVELRPYATPPASAERRGLLLGAPDKPGAYDVKLVIEQSGRTIFDGPLTSLLVTKDVTSTIANIETLPAVRERAFRLAWLREQRVPRMPNRTFGSVSDRLLASHMTAREPGAYILRLRNNARLGDLTEVPPALTAAETRVATDYTAECAVAGVAPRERVDDALCLGRHIDQLRRWGYLRVLSRVPDLARKLHELREMLPTLTLSERYRLLVALTLADASDMGLQRQLFEVRLALATSGPFPSL